MSDSATRQRECNVSLLDVSPLDVMVMLMMWVGISCDPLTGAAGAGPAWGHEEGEERRGSVASGHYNCRQCSKRLSQTIRWVRQHQHQPSLGYDQRLYSYLENWEQHLTRLDCSGLESESHSLNSSCRKQSRDKDWQCRLTTDTACVGLGVSRQKQNITLTHWDYVYTDTKYNTS